MSPDRFRFFRWLHAAWAVVGATACVLLALAKGHPPGLVFVPFAAAAWALGHGVLWLIRRLLLWSERSLQQDGMASGNWPPFLIVLAFCCGVVLIVGLIGLAGKLVFGGVGLMELVILFFICVPPSLCFLGILMRKNWARILASTIFFAVAGFLVLEAVSAMMRDRRLPLGEWIAVIIIVSLTITLGLYILRSRRIKAFFGRD